MELTITKDDSIQCLIPINEMLAYSKSYLQKHDYAFDFHLLPSEIALILNSLDQLLLLQFFSPPSVLNLVLKLHEGGELSLS